MGSFLENKSQTIFGFYNHLDAATSKTDNDGNTSYPSSIRCVYEGRETLSCQKMSYFRPLAITVAVGVVVAAAAVADLLRDRLEFVFSPGVTPSG